MSWQLCSHTITVRCYIQTDFQSRPRIGPSRPGNEISQELTLLVADQLHLVIHVQLQLLVSVFVQLTSVGTVTSDTGCPRKTFTYLLTYFFYQSYNRLDGISSREASGRPEKVYYRLDVLLLCNKKLWRDINRPHELTPIRPNKSKSPAEPDQLPLNRRNVTPLTLSQ